MSQTSKFDRYAARSENRLSAHASWHPPGSNVIVFQPSKAASRPEIDGSVAAGAKIVLFNARCRSRLVNAAPRSWWVENAKVGISERRDEDFQRTRENILAIGWVGTFMAISYCMMTMPIPMH